MKYILLILLLIAVSCKQPAHNPAHTPDHSTNHNPGQEKAETAVKKYLDSLNQSAKYEIVGFDKAKAVYNGISDDPNFEKYKFDRSKIDSIQKHFKPSVVEWIIFVTYKGKNSKGVDGEYKYQCVINKDLTKCVAGIEVADVKTGD
jgi:hypothetical protein